MTRRAFYVWLGGQFYTTKTLAAEAMTQGVCRRIPRPPNGLQLGKTPIFLITDVTGRHEEEVERTRGLNKGTTYKKVQVERGEGNSIVGFFVPQAIELIVPDSITKEQSDEMQKRGVDIVVVSKARREAIRACGVRQLGGYYLVARSGDQLLLELAQEWGQDVTLHGPLVLFNTPISTPLKRIRGIGTFDLEGLPQVIHAMPVS